IEFSEKRDHGSSVKVILMLGGFHRLGLDKESSLEAIAATVVTRRMQESGEMFLFTLHVGVQQRHVAFPSAPKHIVGSTEGYRSVDGILYLGGCVAHDIKVWICGSAIHVARVSEQVCRSPKQLHAGGFLFLLCVVYNLLQALFRFF